MDTSRRAQHFRVEEFADLSDGRRLILTRDRGWSSAPSGGRSPDELWAHISVEDITSTVLAVVLPDEAKDTGEEHPWDRLAERIRALGVEAAAEHLRHLPYDVELSERLLTRVTDGR